MNIELKDVGGWVITVIVSIVGWWLAIRQVNIQHTKNIQLQEQNI